MSLRFTVGAVRAQYHFRPSPQGLLAWDVRRLITLSAGLPVIHRPAASFAELDENHWYQHDPPTPRSMIEHARLIDAADLDFPIILDAAGRVMDGMHRICKAVRDGVENVACVQFATDPEPDYVGRQPHTLPYEN